MVSSILLVACLNILLSPWTRADLFSAIAHIEPLLETQKLIIDDLADYIMKEDIRLTVLKSHLKIYKDEYKNAIEDIPNYIENPLNAFNLIKRLTTDLNETNNYIQLGKEYTESATLNHTDVKYPSLEDLIGAAEAIIRLQTTYHLDVHDLAEGRIMGVKQGNPMSAADCFGLSLTLYDLYDYQNTVKWGMEALRKYRQEASPPPSLKETKIVEYIGFSHYLMGNITTALKWTRRLLKLDPNHPRARKNVAIFEHLIANKLTNKTKQGEHPDTKDTEGEIPISDLKAKREAIKAFGMLCRGEGEIASYVAKRLQCRYMAETHPFLRLAPFKVEQLYIDPDVFLFHDVMSDREIETLKKKATPRLRRSAAGKNLTVDYRISKQSCLHDVESPVIARVTQRVAAMTGLSVASAEELQVLNYGIGGHYTPHVDFVFNTEIMDKMWKRHPEGDRIATVLFYMSNVEQGGATVFLDLGLSVVPVKGTALFWLNLLPSGEGDFNTRHGACPVLRGSKWVSTKWLHQGGQEFLKPCNLE